jgi:hypothetical protein
VVSLGSLARAADNRKRDAVTDPTASGPSAGTTGDVEFKSPGHLRGGRAQVIDPRGDLQRGLQLQQDIGMAFSPSRVHAGVEAAVVY